MTWNGLNWLKTFLPTVVASAVGGTEIIIADNASTDGTAAWVNSEYPHIIVRSFAHNLGYCGGNNRAAENATGDILIFLNNDVEVDCDWLTPIQDAFRSNHRLGAAQPKIMSFHDWERFEYAGAAGGMLDKFGYPFCLGRVFDTCEVDTGQYDGLGNSIFWASGAALAVRKKIFIEAGGFDEDFQFHMEEIDLCWKIHRMGFDISCIPNSIVHHVGGGSLEVGSAKKLAYNLRNNLTMLYKHLPMTQFIYVFTVRLLLDAAAAFRELLKGKFRHFWAIAAAHKHFIFHIGRSYRKRRELLVKNLPFHTALMTPILLPWHYFIKRRTTARQLLDVVTKV